ncbi:MAG: hypothetical protein OEY11_13455 [Gammaproteobacteria bacterium]|nr:hypothetical protein [Gammaproteobacteria bacterium]
MQKIINNLFSNELFNMLINAVIAYTILTATIIVILQVPPDAILDSGLTEVVLVFEDYPDGGIYE